MVFKEEFLPVLNGSVFYLSAGDIAVVSVPYIRTFSTFLDDIRFSLPE